MLGPVGRGSAPPRRRRRWWPYLLGGLVLALVVGEVTNQVVSSANGAAQRSAGSWVAAVSPLVDESNALVPELVEVRDRATQLRRAQLESLLSELVDGSEQVRAQLAALALAPPTSAAGSALAGVLAGRARASEALASALTLVISSSGPASAQAATEKIASAATRLRLADEDYRGFRRLLPARSGGGRLPPSIWILRPASWQPAVLAGWVGLLRHTPALEGRRALSLLAVSLRPSPLEIRGLPTTTTTSTTTTTTTTTSTSRPPTTSAAKSTRPARSSGSPASSVSGTKATSGSSTTTSSTTVPLSTTTTLQIPPPGSVSVVPATARVVVTAVVASTGNLSVPGGLVQANLDPVPGPAALREKAAQVDARVGALAPGHAHSVSLPPLAVQPAGTYDLVVTATFPGGTPAKATIRLTIEP